MSQSQTLSKQYKLPKEFWVKGKSKFLYPRLREEGISFGDRGWSGTITRAPIDILFDKLRGKLGTLSDHLKRQGVDKRVNMWSPDRFLLEIVKFLVSNGADMNIKDKVSCI